MKERIVIVVMALLAVVAIATETNSTSAEAGDKYTKTIEARTDGILKSLALSDTNKIARVHDTIIAQYRALNSWHDSNDAKLKAAGKDTNAVAQIRASLKTLHDNFLSALAENLSSEQVDQVKDKMTYGKVQFTYTGYVNQYPNLSDADKQKILELLQQAREEAMDGGSAAEKTAIFQRYKGRINNYLSKQGIHAPQKSPVRTNSIDLN